jgi:hypothetical protein
MEDSRAYTRITQGNVVLGNRFAERVWSAFIGNTVSLLEKPNDREWTRRRSPEFFFGTPDVLFDPMALGDISWSEFYAPHGAGICCEKSCETLLFSIDSMCFHSCAGIRRSAALTNHDETPLLIEHAAFEALSAPDVPGLEYIQNFTPSANANAAAGWRWAAMANASGGLLTGVAGDCEFRLDSPEPGQWSWIAPGPVTLAPGETFFFPECVLINFSGPMEESAEGVLSRFFACRAESETWEAQIRAEANE